MLWTIDNHGNIEITQVDAEYCQSIY